MECSSGSSNAIACCAALAEASAAVEFQEYPLLAWPFPFVAPFLDASCLHLAFHGSARIMRPGARKWASCSSQSIGPIYEAVIRRGIFPPRTVIRHLEAGKGAKKEGPRHDYQLTPVLRLEAKWLRKLNSVTQEIKSCMRH